MDPGPRPLRMAALACLIRGAAADNFNDTDAATAFLAIIGDEPQIARLLRGRRGWLSRIGLLGEDGRDRESGGRQQNRDECLHTAESRA